MDETAVLQAFAEKQSNKKMKSDDLNDFSITNWYDTFKAITIKTVLVPIPSSVIEMFNAEEVDWNIEERCPPEFKNVLKDILRTFRAPGAFIKSNWHAPMDAQMLSFDKTMSLNNIPDLFLFLNGSSIIGQDFSHKDFKDYCLALRQWTDINPAYEFRCIVINNILRGITPRDWPSYFPHYAKEGDDIIDKISNFFKDKLQGKFIRSNYVFDVYMKHPDTIVLVDFSALNTKTCLHAFEWDEVLPIIKKNSQEPVAPVFRYLDTEIGMMGKAETQLQLMRSKYRLN